MRIVAAVPKGDDPWGVLAPLRGTVWGSLVREVSGEAMAHARHGFATPLMREIGPHPRVLSRKVPDEDGLCAFARDGSCAGATLSCRPGPKLPDCYEPPRLADPEAQRLATTVALAWRDGSYVVVVVGGEFSLG